MEPTSNRPDESARSASIRLTLSAPDALATFEDIAQQTLLAGAAQEHDLLAFLTAKAAALGVHSLDAGATLKRLVSLPSVQLASCNARLRRSEAAAEALRCELAALRNGLACPRWTDPTDPSTLPEGSIRGIGTPRFRCPGLICAVEITGDGRRLAVLVQGRGTTGRAGAFIWDMDTACLTSRTDARHRGRALCLSTGGEFVLQTKGDTLLTIWHAATGAEVASLGTSSKSRPRTGALSENARRAAFNEGETTIHIWDIGVGVIDSVHLPHPLCGAEFLTLAADGSHAVCTIEDRRSHDTLLYFWKVGGNSAPVVTRLARAHEYRRAASSDAELFAYETTDKTVVILSSRTGRELWRGDASALEGDVLGDLPDFERAIVFYPRPAHRSPSIIRTYYGSQNMMFDSQQKRLVYTTGHSPWIRVYGADSDRPRVPSEGQDRGIESLVFSMDGSRILSAGREGRENRVDIWCVADGKHVASFPGDVGAPLGGNSCWAVLDQSDLVVVSADGEVLWRETLLKSDFHGFWSARARLVNSPDGRHVLFSRGTQLGVSGTEQLDWQVWFRPGPGEARFIGLAITPDGRRLVLASDQKRGWGLRGCEGTVHVGDLRLRDPFESRRPDIVARFSFMIPGVAVLALTSDGQEFVTIDRDGVIRLWRLETGQLVRTIGVQQANSAVVTPCGNYLITTANDDALSIWDLAASRLVRVFTNSSNPTCLSVSRDGRWLATGNGDGTITLYELCNLTSCLSPVGERAGSLPPLT